MGVIDQAVGPAVAVRGADGADVPQDAVLTGDRLCAGCCFNLTGQTILKEPRSGLLIVRCPECGLPAALQEYPLLGKWSARLGYLFAGMWLAGMLALVAATSGILFAIGSSVHDAVAAPYAAHVSLMYNEYTQKLTAAASAAGGGAGGAGSANVWQQAATWWSGLDKAKLFEDFGGARALAWSRLAQLAGWTLVLVPLGAAWAVAAPHARLRHWLAIVAMLAAGWVFLWVMTERPLTMMWGMDWYGEAGARTRLLVLPLVLGVEVLLTTGGFILGRTLARWVVVALLPPRLRGPLAFLWLVDGKRPPRPGA